MTIHDLCRVTVQDYICDIKFEQLHPSGTDNKAVCPIHNLEGSVLQLFCSRSSFPPLGRRCHKR